MIISASKIIELNEKYSFIENLAERELNPEGVGIDIRAGVIYRLKGKGFLGVDERDTPDIEIIADINQGDKKVILNPGDYVLVKTIEKINIPGEKIIIEE